MSGSPVGVFDRPEEIVAGDRLVECLLVQLLQLPRAEKPELPPRPEHGGEVSVTVWRERLVGEGERSQRVDVGVPRERGVEVRRRPALLLPGFRE